MITLYRKNKSEEAEALHQKLKDLVIAFEVELLPEAAGRDVMIKESGKEISGKKEIEEWVLTLERELNFQRSITGDACYIDPETGNVC